MSRRLLLGIVCAIMTTAAPARATEHVDAARAVAVRVVDLAGAPLAIRRRALAQAARLFERIDVTIVWDAPLPGSADHFGDGRKGLDLYVDGKRVASSPRLARLLVP